MNQSDPNGYLAVPSSGQGPGVLVLHAWWGLTDVIKEVCQRLAGEGYVAYAPDLYHGKLAKTIEEAEKLGSELDRNQDQVKADIDKAVDLLWHQAQTDQHGLAVIGFSLGAFHALTLSAQDPDRISAVVLFYGTGQADFMRSKAAYMGHFAETDPYEPMEYVDGLEKAIQDSGRPVTFYRYQGVGHWFFEPDRVDAYDEPLAIIAWERTVAFLDYHLSSSSVR